MKLVYLPLDSRPCNTQFPRELCALRGVTPVMPPPSLLDHFRQPSLHRPVRVWLAAETLDADALVVSLDQLCFGSLLASREEDVDEEEALRRLECLAACKAANPGLVIHGISVIMRSAISTFSASDVNYHAAMTAYSQAVHRAQLEQSAETAAALEQARRALPEPLFAKYTAVRARNHRVNRAAVELTARGVMDRLLLLQEDSQTLGIPKLEQAVLQEDIARHACGERVYLHNGADEGGCLACAAVLTRQEGLRLRPIWLRGNGGFTALYEDRPFVENLRSHCAYAGIELVGEKEPADCLLCIDTPVDGIQHDLNDRTALATKDNRAAAERLADALNTGLPVGFLDLLYANGGDDAVLTLAGEQADLSTLRAYAAWNTASNSLGTILAQLLCSGGKTSPGNTCFMLERLLDDYGYQGKVRAQLADEVRAGGDVPYSLRDPGRWERRLAGLYEDFVTQDPTLGHWHFTYRVQLPWPRVFEAEFTVTTLEEQ